MPNYTWGRQFHAEEHLAQRRADRPNHGVSLQRKNSGLPQATKVVRASEEAWMWKGIRWREVVGTVSASALGSPSNADKVTSSQGCDLICSYDLQMGGEYLFPGCLPEWKEISLPVTLNRNQRLTPRIWPRYSLEPMFRAVGEMNPGLRFDDIDIVSNRNSLRSLLVFCSANSSCASFRLNLQVAHDTLLIESYDLRPFVDSGFGRVFEDACRSYPDGWREGTSHYRALRYFLGELSCVVRCEVDASYNGTEETSWTSPSNGPDLDKLSRYFQSSANIRTQNEDETMRQAGLKHQSTAAEIKSTASNILPSKFMPQLWFGRTPWLLCGTHSRGTFHQVSIADAGASFGAWEELHQGKLQRLVMVLKQLRAIARASGAGEYAAVFEAKPKSRAREIKVFKTTKQWQALPESLIPRFWGL